MHLYRCMGRLSAEIASVMAKEAFIHEILEVLDKDAALITMSWNPETSDDAKAGHS